jgi:hypothetical protein
LSLVSPTAASIVEEGKGEIAGEAPTTEATSKSTPLPDTRARQAYINACEEIELGDTEFYGNSRQYFEVPECQLHRPIDDFITKICQAILELRTTRRWRYLQMHQDEEVYKDSLAIRIMTYRDVI